MVRLTQREEKYYAVIEERIAFLEARLKSASAKDFQYDKEEHAALCWLVEVVGHAAATNCEAAFAEAKVRTEAPASEEEFFEFLEWQRLERKIIPPEESQPAEETLLELLLQ
jgi:hypothetical protein